MNTNEETMRWLTALACALPPQYDSTEFHVTANESDPSVQGALCFFQFEHGLTATGRLDYPTMQKLEDIMNPPGQDHYLDRLVTEEWQHLGSQALLFL